MRSGKTFIAFFIARLTALSTGQTANGANSLYMNYCDRKQDEVTSVHDRRGAMDRDSFGGAFALVRRHGRRLRGRARRRSTASPNRASQAARAASPARRPRRFGRRSTRRRARTAPAAQVRKRAAAARKQPRAASPALCRRGRPFPRFRRRQRARTGGERAHARRIARKTRGFRRLRAEKLGDPAGFRRRRARRPNHDRRRGAGRGRGSHRAGPLSAAPGNCSTRCSPPSASTAPRSISPMSCRGARPATARRRRRSWRLCLPFIRRQIELVSPDFLVLLGASAAQTLLERKGGHHAAARPLARLSLRRQDHSRPAHAASRPICCARRSKKRRPGATCAR